MRSEKEIRQLIDDLNFMMMSDELDHDSGSHLMAARAGLKFALGECDDAPSKSLAEARQWVVAAKGVHN